MIRLSEQHVGTLLCAAGGSLRAAGIPNPRFEARMLLGHAMATSSEALLREPGATVLPQAVARFRMMVAQRLAHVPMAQIIGRGGFWTLDLEVSAETLVPRADSETLIEAVLAAGLAPRRILDLGTGTGCLLLALLAEFPEAWGVGVDVRPGAAALAARNGRGTRALFYAGSWGDALNARFDLVISNPPYIESAAIPTLMPEVARYEPATALDGGPDGLDAYRMILEQASRLLVPGGYLVLELGLGQAKRVEALATGMRVVAMREDLGGVPRALILEVS